MLHFEFACLLVSYMPLGIAPRAGAALTRCMVHEQPRQRLHLTSERRFLAQAPSVRTRVTRTRLFPLLLRDGQSRRRGPDE